MALAARARATWRMAALMASAVALLSLLAMVLQYGLVEHRLNEAQRNLLAADLGGFAALYEQRRIIALRQAIDYRSGAGNADEAFRLSDREGRVLAGRLPGGLVPPASSGTGFALDPAQELGVDGTRWLAVSRGLPGGFVLVAARSLGPVDATLAAMRRGMIGLMAGLVIAGALVGWLAARQVMGRIGRLNALADRVAAGALDARLPGPRSHDEFGLLESHVHAMLDRIENLNRATHRLSDTIAHEMRTPLNRILSRIERIEGQEELTASIRAEMRQAVRVFDSLLDISRAEADRGSGGGLVPVDLSRVVAGVWEFYEAAAEDRGLATGARIAPGLAVLGDRNLLAQLVANLLDNAIKYCAPGDGLRVELEAGGDGGRITLRVSDTGPGLPPGMGEEMFERFTRAERDRAGAVRGHGLGLALVRAIALRHGARLALPRVARGLTIEIAFPVPEGRRPGAGRGGG